MTNYQNEDPVPVGLAGIEIMTAFIDNPDSTDFMFDLIETIARDERSKGLVRSTTGLWRVAAYLLVRLSKATGQSEREILQQAAQYLSEG